MFVLLPLIPTSISISLLNESKLHNFMAGKHGIIHVYLLKVRLHSKFLMYILIYECIYTGTWEGKSGNE